MLEISLVQQIPNGSRARETLVNLLITFLHIVENGVITSEAVSAAAAGGGPDAPPFSQAIWRPSVDVCGKVYLPPVLLIARRILEYDVYIGTDWAANLQTR